MEPLLSVETESVLRLQGISTEVRIGTYKVDGLVPLLRAAGAGAELVPFVTLDGMVKAARSSEHYVMVVDAAWVAPLMQALGSEASLTVAILAAPSASGPSAGTLRAMGVMAVLSDPSEATLRALLRRGMELRALRALELAHRCESRRLKRREMALTGSPPETLTDDLNTAQPPPLPVGPISTYNLEEASEAFERAYIDRVQHLTDSAREAAQFLDVSAATLARRTRKDAAHGG